MAASRQRQRRKRKHRGTQAGTIKAPRSPKAAAKGRTNASAKMTPQQRRQQRFETPPSWKTAIKRALITAGLLFIVFAFVLNKNGIQNAILFSLLSACLYAPAFYFVDSFTYQRAQRRKLREREQKDSS